KKLQLARRWQWPDPERSVPVPGLTSATAGASHHRCARLPPGFLIPAEVLAGVRRLRAVGEEEAETQLLGRDLSGSLGQHLVFGVERVELASAGREDEGVEDEANRVGRDRGQVDGDVLGIGE